MDILRRTDGRIILVNKVEAIIMKPKINENDSKNEKGVKENVSDTVKKCCPEELQERKNSS
ncbi:MAG: hypothetical protein KKF50_04775 [Nanoarchaeota archaeon]|nr:hypothetical protein [Nanoarchaeota archaeon]